MHPRTTDDPVTSAGSVARAPVLSLADRVHLEQAVALAAHGPAADPNPRVGAVIVDATGDVVGEGWHRGAGTAHAETVALAEAGVRASGGTAYVSLEPCRHTGRTGPCTRALIQAGIARVVFAQPDPDPRAGGGAAELGAAGVAVASPAAGDPVIARAAALNEAWAFALRHGRPRVVWKTATTLDGRSAAADGSSQWITAPNTRARGHRLRAECGAILVGTGTALADNPSLTVRLADEPGGAMPDGRARPPLRVVLGRRALPPAAALHDDSAPTLHLRHRDPARALAELQDRGVRQVLLEGGPTLAAAFLRAGLVDRIELHLAPALFGAGTTLGDFGIGTLADACRLTIRTVEHLDPDVVIVADVRRRPSGPDPISDTTPNSKETCTCSPA